MFTYHPLFELFFHRSYLKTTTNINKELKTFAFSDMQSMIETTIKHPLQNIVGVSVVTVEKDLYFIS